MRILTVNDYATPTGGAELLMARLVAGLTSRGHDVRTFASYAARPEDEPRADYLSRGTLGLSRTALQVHNRSARRGFEQAIAEFRPDIVHLGLFLTQLSPLILDGLEDVPTVYHAQWYRAVCPTGTKHLPAGTSCQSPWGPACYRNGCLSLPAWVAAMAQRGAWLKRTSAIDTFVAVGESVRTRLEEAGLGPVVVIPNSAPPGAAPREPQTATGHDDVTIGFAGRLEPEKGVLVLLEVFASLLVAHPEVRMVLVGDGSARAQIERRAHDLGVSDRLEITGWLSRDAAEDRLRGTILQVVPSQWEEPFGLVAVEALKRGTPVVVSDSGGLVEIVRHGETGLRVAAADVEGWVEAIGSLLADTGLRTRLAAAGRHDAEHRFSEDLWLDRFERLYEALIAA